jgi:glutamate racemase
MQPMHSSNIGLRERVAELAAARSAKVITIGVASVVLAPVVLPLIRPVLKATIKSGVTLFERAKHSIAETGEVLADIAAEARAEAQIEAQKRAAFQAKLAAAKTTVPEVQG